MQIYAPLTSEAEPSLQKIEIASSFQLPGFHVRTSGARSLRSQRTNPRGDGGLQIPPSQKTCRSQPSTCEHPKARHRNRPSDGASRTDVEFYSRAARARAEGRGL